MHSAPAVSFPTGRPRGVRLVAAAIWMLGLAVSLAATFDGEAWRVAMTIAASATIGAAAWSHLGRQPLGSLCFDGQFWSISVNGRTRSGRLQVCLDLQSLMLLRLIAAEERSRWLWVDSRADPGRWRDLRCAVYSRAPTIADVAEPGRAPGADSRFSAFR